MTIRPTYIRSAGKASCLLTTVLILVLSAYGALSTEGEKFEASNLALFGLLSSMAVLNVPIVVGYRDFGLIEKSSGWYVQWFVAFLLSLVYLSYGLFEVDRVGDKVIHMVPIYSIALGLPHILLLPLYMVVQFESRRSSEADASNTPVDIALNKK